ncbi:MAG: heparinase II/III family protein [Chloroflexi bacterium]|nr:heparinase II/III family protein [Chloroflexota bacterium]
MSQMHRRSQRISRRTALRVTLAAGVAATFGLAAGADGRVTSAARSAVAAVLGKQAGPTPRILLPDDFTAIRAKIDGQAWARDVFGSLKRFADGLVAGAPPIPETGGGWFHAGGEGYEITRVHNRLAEGVRALGIVYRLTDDMAYVQAARSILLGYATRYPGYEPHDQYGRTGPKAYHPGKATSQGLDEGIWLAALAFGYDLVQEGIAAEDRQTIASGLLRPAADLLTAYNVGRQNHQTYYNLGIGLTGFALAEPRYVEHAILKPDSGLVYQLSPGASYTADGFWYEGSVHYHYYALEGILGLAEAAQRNGYDPYGLPLLRAAFEFPLAYADAEGRLPAFNDGPPASLFESWRGRQYEIAYARYGDPRYGALVARAGRSNSYHSLVYGVAELPAPSELTTGSGPSTILADRTIPVLRAGEGSRRLQLAINAMPYVGSHSQPAQLEIDLSAGPNRVVPAPASIKYADPLHAGWYRQTISHSTVIVEGKSQGRGGPTEIVAFQAGTLAQVSRVRSGSAYPGTLLDRICVLLDVGLLDLFLVTGGQEATLDWALHHAGDLAVELPTQARRAPPLPGYQELEDVFDGRTDAPWRARWTLADGSQSALWVGAAPGTTVIAGRGYIGGPDQNNDPTMVSALIVRRQAASTAFLSALLEGGDGSETVTIRPATRGGTAVGAEQAVGLTIATATATYAVWLAAGPESYQIDGRQMVGGQVLVERTDTDGMTRTESAALG